MNSLILLAAITVGSDGSPPKFTVVNNAPRFSVVNNVGKVRVQTTCGCGKTGDCLCFVGECSCPACGLGSGGASKQAGKPQGSGTIQTTPVRTAGGPVRPDTARGSSVDTPPAGTSTGATLAAPAGFTSGGCANGNCPTGSTRTYSRSSFRLFR